ncbi:MAG TPA: hypothetical protein VK837_12605 [Longimicrobiales bacterium]|nr:hypothetical protein [Longimicrobiales bacterium]
MTAGRPIGFAGRVRGWWRVWAYEAYATDGRSLAIVRVAYGLIPGGTTVRFVDFAWISVAGALTALFCLDAIGGARRGARGAS